MWGGPSSHDVTCPKAPRASKLFNVGTTLQPRKPSAHAQARKYPQLTCRLFPFPVAKLASSSRTLARAPADDMDSFKLLQGPMSAPTTKSKRNPTVLMTDTRDAPQRRPLAQRQDTAQFRPGAKLISVDNILQYASDIPSAQRRGPPGHRPLMHTRTPSGRHPLDPKLTGRLIPAHMPSRTSKLSEKLVLLPDTQEDDDDEKGDFDEEEEGPPTDEDLSRRTTKGGPKDKSYAERLPKARRAEKLSRVTAYCTAQAYKMKSTAEFVKTQHNARTKLYDDCLYCVYHLPLLPGSDGYRVRSSPALKSPGGKTVLDEEIERNERREHSEEYFEDTEEYSVRHGDEEDPTHSPRRDFVEFHSPSRDMLDGLTTRVPPNALSFGEMFVFSYGVVVFWNFTEKQEKDILADLTFSTSSTNILLATRPLKEEDFETEEFHFEYNPEIPRPRVYNDMITLKSGDHMIKLAMSHAIAQSTKLSLFEEGMARTMLQAQYVPKRLALTGKLGMARTDVVKMIGQLFTSRVDVNLCKCAPPKWPSKSERYANDITPQHPTCSTRPISSGTPNPHCIRCTPPCASTSKSSRASKSSTSAAGCSSTWARSCRIPSRIRR